MTEDEARVWLQRTINNFGLAFHWDTSAFDYVKEDGAHVFTIAEATRFDRECDAAYIALCPSVDPYGLALEYMQALA